MKNSLLMRRKKEEIEEKLISFRSECEELQLTYALNIQVSKELYITNMFLGVSIRLCRYKKKRSLQIQWNNFIILF